MVQCAHESASPPRLSRRTIAAGALLAALAAFAGLEGLLPRPWQGAAAPADPLPALRARLATARAFSAEPALQLAPRFSADGRQVAFALGDERESRIVVQAVDGSSRQFVGEAGALRLSPVFFPGGQRIAYWKSSAGSCGIVEYDLRTGAEAPLVDCALLPRVRFDLSPDGRSLVFTGAGQPQDPAGLWIVDVATGQRRALTTPGPGHGDDLHPRFSPDGRHVAFFRGRDSRRQPFVLATGGGVPRALTTRVGQGQGLAWMGPAGPLLVAADWSGATGLHLLDAASGAARTLGVHAARFPDVSPAGDVVYEHDRRAGAAPRTGLTEAAHAVEAGTSPAPVELMMVRAKR